MSVQFPDEVLVNILNFSNDPRNALVCRQWQRCQETANEYSITAFKNFIDRFFHPIRCARIINSNDRSTQKLSQLMFLSITTTNAARKSTGGTTTQEFNRYNALLMQHFIDTALIESWKYEDLPRYIMEKLDKQTLSSDEITTCFKEIKKHLQSSHFPRGLYATTVCESFYHISQDLKHTVSHPYLLAFLRMSEADQKAILNQLNALAFQNLDPREIITLIVNDPLALDSFREINAKIPLSISTCEEIFDVMPPAMKEGVQKTEHDKIKQKLFAAYENWYSNASYKAKVHIHTTVDNFKRDFPLEQIDISLMGDVTRNKWIAAINEWIYFSDKLEAHYSKNLFSQDFTTPFSYIKEQTALLTEEGILLEILRNNLL